MRLVPRSRPLAVLLLAGVSACFLLAVPSTQPTAVAQGRLKLSFTPEVGNRTTYAIVKTRQRTKSGRLERDLKTTSKAELTLLAASDQGLIFRFVILETKATTPGTSQPKLDRLLSRLASITSEIPLIYQADSTGTPLYLINSKEVLKAIQAILPDLQAAVRELGREGIVSPAERAKLKAMVNGTYGALTALSERELAVVVLEEVGLLFAATGRDFPIGEKESFETQTTIPMIGWPVRVSGKRLIKSLDEDTKIAVVEIETAYDRARLLDALAQAASRLASSVDEAERHLEAGIRALGDFQVAESSLLMVDQESGAPLALRHQRTMTFGETTVVEVTKIRRVRP